jgi:hypothetical protein
MLLTANHDGQRGVARPDIAAADRGIERSIAGGLAIESVPRGPRCTSSTSSGTLTMLIATSAPFAACAGESAHDAPRSSNACAFAFVRE